MKTKQAGMQRRFRVRLDTFLAHAGKALGWIGAVFWGVIGLVGLSEMLFGGADRPIDRVMPFICLGLAALHGLLIWSASGMKELIRDFRLYSAALARDADKSILGLSQRLGLPLETVLQRLQKMCRRGYFNGFLNLRDQCLCLHTDEPLSQQVVYCPGCGAGNAVSRAGGVCRYCGSPLSVSS